MKTPYPFQAEARDVFLAKYAEGKRSGLYVAPTGTGKTYTARVIRDGFERVIGRPPRTLFLVHREELADQAREEFAESVGADHVGIIQGPNSQFGRLISIAMVQTASQTRRLDRLQGTTHDLVFVDEAHHGIEGSQYHKVLRRLRHDHTLTIGLTATPDRADGIGLLEMYGFVHRGIKIEDAIAQGFLVDVWGQSIALDVDLDALKPGKNGDFTDKAVGHVMAHPSIRAATVTEWLARARDRRTIGFCATKEHARLLAEDFRAAGVAASYVEGNTPKDIRRALYAALACGDLQVLLSVGVLTEGFNEKAVDCVLLVRPTRSRGLFAQMIGRGLRTLPGKRSCFLLDITGTAQKTSLVSLAMLGGLPAEQDDESPAVKAATGPAVQREGAVTTYSALTDIARTARDVNLLRAPRGKRYRWLDHALGQVLSLGSAEAGMLLVKRHADDDRANRGKCKIVHLQRVRTSPSAVDPQGGWRFETLEAGVWPDEAIALCEQTAGRFSPPRSGIVIGPADPVDVRTAQIDIATREAEVNAHRSRPMVDAARAATPQSLGELTRRGIRTNDAQRAALTHGEVEQMLRQGRAAGWRAVRLPERIRGLA